MRPTITPFDRVGSTAFMNAASPATYAADVDAPLRPRVVDAVLQVRAEVGRPEGHEDDVATVVGGPEDAGDDVAVPALAVGAEHGDRNDLHARIRDGRDAVTRDCVRLRGNDA